MEPTERIEIPRLTPAEQERALEVVERLKRRQEEILAARGGEPFAPPGWEILNELRDERSDQL